MQQQPLLPPKEPLNNALLEAQTKKSELLPKSEDKTKDIDEGRQPGYARPKRAVRRVRSKTPPPSRAKSPVRRATKSPLRSRPKSPVPGKKLDSSNKLRSKSPTPRRNGGKGEKKRIILSPNSQKRSERQNRPSFQGMSVIDGRRKNRDNQDKSEEDDINKMKAERRRNSLNFMSKSAQSAQIREMLDATMDDYLTAFVVEGTAEERLQAVMTKAKERGMAPENIFSFFNGGNPNTTHITKESFLDALERLGDTFVVITDEELTKIVKKFDHNNDGKVSIDEFKNYCYEIPSVPWKAERMRLERSGELKKLKAQLSRRFTLSDMEDGHSCGNKVHRTSKFFWKTNNNVEIRLFYSEVLNVITVQLYSQTFEKELPSIYICRNKVEYQISKLELEINDTTPDTASEDTKEPDHQVTWEVISKYIITRLKLKTHEEIAEDEVPKLECAHIPNEASYIPFLCKLTGDTFDTLMIQKPLNLSPPQSISSGPVNSDTFEEKVASFHKEARKARASRQSAQGLTNLVASALSEVEASI